MYTVTKEIHFCYGHRLLNYEGKCKNLHGHNGRAEIELASDALDHRGMVVDFHDIKKVLQTWIDQELDHKMILCRKDPLLEKLSGEPTFLVDENPTAEAIAKLIYDTAEKHGFPVTRVTLWETVTSFATYQPQAKAKIS